MSYKIGDNMVCRDDYIENPHFKDVNTNFDKGCDYSIMATEGHTSYWLLDNNGVGKFFTTDKDSVTGRYLWKYFYTEKELRKVKLEEIESGR